MCTNIKKDKKLFFKVWEPKLCCLFFSLHHPEKNTEKNRFSLNRPREAVSGVDNSWTAVNCRSCQPGSCFRGTRPPLESIAAPSRQITGQIIVCSTVPHLQTGWLSPPLERRAMQPKAALTLSIDVPSHHSWLLLGLGLVGGTGEKTWENSWETQAWHCRK